jgi:hypothetical protein
VCLIAQIEPGRQRRPILQVDVNMSFVVIGDKTISDANFRGTDLECDS